MNSAIAIAGPARSAPSARKTHRRGRWPALRLYGGVLLASLASSVVVGLFIRAHVPKIHDEFAYLLAGQTFAEFRLTNPAPALGRFFEAPHVLVTPSYTAKFPPGHGLALAVGYWLGDPIRGVWLECAAFAVAFTWMLRGFFRARWALLGGALVILQFGATHYWAQTFWGGALAATGGALVFGATRRLTRRLRVGDALALGGGVVVLLLTRPFEGALVCLVPVVLLLPRLRAPGAGLRLVLPAGSVIALGAVFFGLYNQRVTGSIWHTPYGVYEAQYSGRPLFVWEPVRPDPPFANEPLRRYYDEYVVRMSQWHHALPVVLLRRVGSLLSEYLGAALALAALAGALVHRARWSGFALASLSVGIAGAMLCYWFSDSHYQAPAAALYLFLAVAGIRACWLRLSGRRRAVFVVALAVAQLAVVGVAQAGPRRLSLHRATTNRQNILEAVRTLPGRKLVFVRRLAPYSVHDAWVFNEADLARSNILWAWDRGAEDNRALLAQYPDRTALLLIEQNRHVELVRYPATAAATP
jgi:hypothetical protein